jgi:hypothetical protein
MAGELVAAVVGVPGSGGVAGLEARRQQSLAALSRARAERAATEAVLERLRAPVAEAVEAVTRGGTLAAAPSRRLSAAVRQLEEAAAAAREGLARSGGTTLLRGLADEADSLAAAGRAALYGRRVEAATARHAAETLQGGTREAAETLAGAERRLEAATRPALAGAGETVRRGPLRAPASPAPLEDVAPPPRTRVPALSDPPPAGSPKTPAPAPPRLAELEARAEALMRAGRFDDAAAALHVASRHREATGNVLTRILARLSEARGAARAKSVFQARSRLEGVRRLAAEADEAMRPFAEAERAYAKRLGREDMVPLTGAGGARRIDAPDGKPLGVWKPAARSGVGDLDEEGQLIAEVVQSRLGRLLGLRVPHAEPLVVDGVPGVLVRWIPQTTDLSRLSPGARAALKDQVAAFRPLQIVTGNYDIHHGNLKVDRAGRVWAIDAGMSHLTTPNVPVSTMSRHAAPGGFRERPEAGALLNWTRWFRDWYSEIGADPAAVHHAPVRRLEGLLAGAEMRGSGQALRRVTDEELGSLLDDVMRHAPSERHRTEDVLRTLSARRDALPDLLNERWADAIPPGR